VQEKSELEPTVVDAWFPKRTGEKEKRRTEECGSHGSSVSTLLRSPLGVEHDIIIAATRLGAIHRHADVVQVCPDEQFIWPAATPEIASPSHDLQR
jgi:hypothetical protein